MNLAAQDLIKVPRTCVVCRKVDEKNRLLRIVHHEEVVFDFAQVLLGRGLYVHCSERCLEEKRLVNTLSKLKKNRSVGGKSRVVAETSLRVDDDRSSRKSSQISLDSLVEGGGRCLELRCEWK